jgi:membrane glycosyltransferase
MSGETTDLEYAMGLVSLVGIVMAVLILVFQWYVLVWPLVVVGTVCLVLGAVNLGRLVR